MTRTSSNHKPASNTIVISDSVRIGPLHIESDLPWRNDDGSHDFLFGPISFDGADGSSLVRESGNGIDSLRLAVFRDDLRTLASHRGGTIEFGDHDYFEILTFVADGEHINLQFTLPGDDIWNLDIDSIPWARIPSIIDQITAVQHPLGPLTGFCKACGKPMATYHQ